MTTVKKPQVEKTTDGLFVVRLQVTVNYGQTWERAIKAGAPNTPANYLIWQAADEYPKPADKSGVVMTDISLLGYGRSWESQEAINYATNKGLPTADPRQTFAIGEDGNYPHLHTDLGKPYLGAVCLQKCSLSGNVLLPYVWFFDVGRRTSTHRFDRRWFDFCWFAVLGEVS